MFFRGVLYAINKKKVQPTFKHICRFVTQKQNLLGSIFPEYFSISDMKCRTPRINDVLRYILQVNNELTQKIGENFSANLEISSLVEQRGGKSKHFEEDLKGYVN